MMRELIVLNTYGESVTFRLDAFGKLIIESDHAADLTQMFEHEECAKVINWFGSL